MKLCPCGSGKTYSECCEPYIAGSQLPLTAEALMRSRYSAYTEHAIDYIVNTCIRKGGKQDIDVKQTKSWSENSRWLGLKILSAEKGGPNDTEGTVEFEAAYEHEGLNDIHHEKALFKKQNDKWLYDEGEIVPKTIVRSSPKVGRNDPCPCGSGKKYKHCHGKG
ncbi:MAG: YchJ family protein [Spirochaetaceae bacterium]|jgi:SEC-C motif-containing protein|nr:YchJ family protein [Spirochaetaceae bacterium]